MISRLSPLTVRGLLFVAGLTCLGSAAAIGFGQTDRARTEAQARRAAERLQALHREADALALQERTLLGDLRRLELEQQMRTDEATQADASLRQISDDLEVTTRRIQEVEAQDLSQQPGLDARLIELYKLGQGGYLRVLLSTEDLQGVGRAYRTVSALAALDRQRLADHQRNLADLRAARSVLAVRQEQAIIVQRVALTAQASLVRATTARTQLIAQIDRRRDLNAQLAGELQSAQQKLQQSLAALAAGRASSATAVFLPFRAFQGDLDWPVRGAVRSRFGRDARGRFGTAIIRNGIEIAAPTGLQARSVHEGTVAFADPFTGFGNIVIVDHGNQAYSLYGHLGSAAVSRGARIERGQTVGVVGTSPTGQPGLYFELRIDGRPVDPLQWLKK